MQAVDAQVDRRALAHLDDLLLDLLLHLGHDLLDACGVDAAVGHQLVQRQARDLAAHGVEAAQNDGLGRVVHDDLDARGGFERTDVAALAADDAALHLVALDVEHRHGVLDGRFGRHALDRRHDDALGLLRRRQLGLLDRLRDISRRVGLGLGLHVLDQDVLGLLGAHARDLLQARILLAHHLIDLLLAVFEHLHLILHLLLQPVVLAQLAVQFALLVLQVVLDLLGLLLALREFLVALIDHAVVFALELYELLFGLEDLLLLDHLALGFGLLHGGFATLLDAVLQYVVRNQNIYRDSGRSGDAGS